MENIHQEVQEYYGTELQKLLVFNQVGQDVTPNINRLSKNENELTFSLSQLPQGYYYVVLNGALVQKVVKK